MSKHQPILEKIPPMFRDQFQPPCSGVEANGEACKEPAVWLCAGKHTAYCDRHKGDGEARLKQIEAL